ncbi:hypothetical protein JD276_07390 [Leucobacter sp. CSA1]|uniref:alpha-amylase n=1 Tax=Leucobacter chromiisoli TaxID=2796471 RepID=A0A934Q903_9MICO|nr:Ig-like domain-containing protein [Leucobacter chromiisoli]MBK0418854.1 hypothetical protein [Leucobacter chromiisoli]
MTIRRPLALGAAATIGFGSLFLASPALAEEAPTAPVETTTADKYELAAAQLGTTKEDVQQQEAADKLLVTEGGFVAHIDPIDVHGHADFEIDEAQVPGDPIGGSRPGAPVTVYLDFDGETLEGTNWNELQGEATLNFAAASGVNEARVWAAVAEDYAPFNVNVTTVNPGADALYKTSTDDNTYGSHVIITDSYTDVLDEAEGTGGIAWRGGTGSDFLRGALVFTEGAGGADATAKSIAEIATHESGHNFGLTHDGHGEEEYYAPTEGLWGPIMGAGYNVPVTQWSIGDYAGATNGEDDLSVITDRGAAEYFLVSVTLPDGTPYDGPVCPVNGSDPQNPQPGDQFQVPNADNQCDGSGAILTTNWTFTDRADFAADDHGDDASGATALDNATGSFAAEGVIGNTADVDAFALSTEGGEVSASVEVADVSPNLNAKLTLMDASGNVVAEDAGNPTRDSEAVASGMGASITANDVEAGTYTLTVEGVGTGNPDNATGANAGGFSNYGSLGNYTLSGEAAPSEDPVVEAPAITAPADGSTVEGPVTAITGTGIPGATVTVTGAVEGTATVNAEGNWTVETNLGAGEYSVSATQAVEGVTSNATTSSFVVTEPEVPAAPTITSITDGQAFPAGQGPSNVSGTGIPGATVTVTVGGQSYTATVGENGTWTVDFGAALAAGSYDLSATQNVGGVDSAAATVSFAVASDNGGGGNGGGDGDGNGEGGNGGGDDLANTGGLSLLPLGITAAAMLLVGGAVTVLAARRQKAAEL